MLGPAKFGAKPEHTVCFVERDTKLAGVRRAELDERMAQVQQYEISLREYWTVARYLPRLPSPFFALLKHSPRECCVRFTPYPLSHLPAASPASLVFEKYTTIASSEKKNGGNGRVLHSRKREYGAGRGVRLVEMGMGEELRGLVLVV